MIQYPFTLQKLVILPTTPVDGFYTPNDGVWVDLCHCRDEGSAIATEQKSLDGSNNVYSFTIQTPKGTPYIEVGTDIRVMDGENVRLFGTVKGCRVGFLHTQIYV